MHIRDIRGEIFQPLGAATRSKPVPPAPTWIHWTAGPRPVFHDKVLIKLDDGFESKYPQCWNEQVWNHTLGHGFRIVAYRYP